MESLWDIYNNLISGDANDWYYYTNQDSCPKNTAHYKRYKPYTKVKYANNFLRGYFSDGDKCVFRVGNEKLNETHERNLHSASLYFLGLSIANKLGYKNFISDSKNILNETPEKRFLFIWFMTCMYHDIGYHFEENFNKYSELNNLDSFLYNYKIEDAYTVDTEVVFYTENNEDNIKNLCENYYKYRYKNNKFDHGITGGIVLYNELVNNYYHARDKYNIEYHSNADEFDYGQLHYSKELFKDYKNAAYAIMRHNLWIADKNSVNEYRNGQLFKLIPSNIDPKGEFTKYSLKNGLLFLLGLADTIEPLKYFKDIEPKFVLKHIEINISRYTMEIKVKSPLIADGYFKNIKKLTEWTNVDVNSDDSACEIEMIDNRKSIEDDWERMILIGIHE